MTTRHWSDRLVALRTCTDAVRWARRQPSYVAAWRACRRGDWMLWLAGRLAGPPGGPRRIPLVLAACECAERVAPLIADEWQAGLALAAIQTAQAWAHGEASLADVRAAADSCWCYAAAVAIAPAAAAAAAEAAAVIADARAADADARASSDAGVYERSLAHAAGIVRRHYPRPPRLP